MDQKRQIGSEIQAGNWDNASRVAAGFGDIDTAMGIRKFQTSERQADAQAKLADVNYQQHLAHLNGGAAQMILAEKDPAKQQQMWGAIRSQHPQFDDTLQKHGINPTDHLAGAQFLMAQARGYRDPLDEAQKRAAIAHSQASTAAAQAQLQQLKMQTPEARANIAIGMGFKPGSTEYNSIALSGTYSPKDEYIKGKEGETFYRRGPNGLEPIEMPGQSGESKDYRKAYDKERGEARAKAELDLPRIVDNAGLALKTIDQLATHPGRATGTGYVGMVAPHIPGTEARGFTNLVDQAKGRVFLEAFNSLRGGGAITENEGAKATQALARLDRAQSDRDFDAALTDLKEVIVIGMRRAHVMAGKADAAAAPTAGGGARYKAVGPNGHTIYSNDGVNWRE